MTLLDAQDNNVMVIKGGPTCTLDAPDMPGISIALSWNNGVAIIICVVMVIKMYDNEHANLVW